MVIRKTCQTQIPKTGSLLGCAHAGTGQRAGPSSLTPSYSQFAVVDARVNVGRARARLRDGRMIRVRKAANVKTVR